MKLIEWQTRKRKTNKDVAAILQCDVSYISHINAGRRTPSASLAYKIEEMTKGYVKLKDLLN